MLSKKPYLIIPKYVEQPTWGGNYIASYKDLNKNIFGNKKIGQSYELFGGSHLQIDQAETRTISEINDAFSLDLLGPHITKEYGKMPLLIKFTQSLGNSFQLHVREQDKSEKWKPKPESWYYFEDGLITLGLNPATEIGEYKQVCLTLEKYMLDLSEKIKAGKLTVSGAAKFAQETIQKYNPWRFVNIHRVTKSTAVDLSLGGVHHSWEEDSITLPLGNIVYEVQLDADDSSSTIRSFDKGKIMKDGTVRPLHVEDYFAYIDNAPLNNSFSHSIRQRKDERIIQTPHYCLDELHISKEKKEHILDSFVHLFIKDGSVMVVSADGSVDLKRGESCLVPYHTASFTLSPQTASAVILKTHILMPSSYSV